MPVGRAEYLNSIQGEIDYQEMKEVWPPEHGVWCVRLVPEQEIGCAWSEVYEGTEYGIVLILQSELEFHYLNPPEGIGRIDFRKTTEAGTLQHLDEIPTPVAQHSLDALPYVSWLEKTGLGLLE